ncbi:MAG: transposase [Oscillospiraceae bacterium]
MQDIDSEGIPPQPVGWLPVLSQGQQVQVHYLGQNLCFHPHIRCIVPAGGHNYLGLWVNSKKKFFLPAKALSCKFRGKFLALLKQQIPDMKHTLLDEC